MIGYTEFDAAGRAVKRYRGTGKPHGKTEPPITYERKPGKGQNADPKWGRPSLPHEIPGGG